MSLMMGDDGEAAVRHLYLTHAAAEGAAVAAAAAVQ